MSIAWRNGVEWVGSTGTMGMMKGVGRDHVKDSEDDRNDARRYASL